MIVLSQVQASVVELVDEVVARCSIGWREDIGIVPPVKDAEGHDDSIIKEAGILLQDMIDSVCLLCEHNEGKLDDIPASVSVAQPSGTAQLEHPTVRLQEEVPAHPAVAISECTYCPSDQRLIAAAGDPLVVQVSQEDPAHCEPVDGSLLVGLLPPPFVVEGLEALDVEQTVAELPQSSAPLVVEDQGSEPAAVEGEDLEGGSSKVATRGSEVEVVSDSEHTAADNAPSPVLQRPAADPVPAAAPSKHIEVEMEEEDPREKSEDEEFNEIYAKLWQARKRDLEQKAEHRAKSTFQEWQRDRRSLEDIIDSSLKEYVELYETAHALRLQFEAEKTKWTSKLLALVSGRLPQGMDTAGFQYDAEEDGEASSAKKRSAEVLVDPSAVDPAPPIARKRFVAPKKL